MLEPVTTAIITGAAGNVVAYMLTGQVDALRAWVRRMFRRGTEGQRSLTLRALEEDIDNLARQAISGLDPIRRTGSIR